MLCENRVLRFGLRHKVLDKQYALNRFASGGQREIISLLFVQRFHPLFLFYVTYIFGFALPKTERKGFYCERFSGWLISRNTQVFIDHIIIICGFIRASVRSDLFCSICQPQYCVYLAALSLALLLFTQCFMWTINYI